MSQHPVLLTVLCCSVLGSASVCPAVTIGLNFTGTSRSQSGFIPPDTMGAVGADHIVEMINGRYRVYDKTDGSLLENRSLNSFWSVAGAPHSGSFSFDPRVQYDPFAQRFYASAVDNSQGANNFLFAVSNSSDPLGGWTGFKVDADSDNLQWADFPQMGFNSEGVFISANMFEITGSGGGFEINMLVLPKADLLAATPSIANATLLESQRSATGFESSLQAAIDWDNSGRPMRMFTTSSAPSNRVDLIQIDGPITNPFVNNIPDVSGLTSYSDPPLADQPGTKTNLDSGGDRTRSAVMLVDGSYWGVHGVDVDGRAALRWYQINADTLLLENEGVITDPDLNFIYGSIAANAEGDIVIGMTGTSENQFPSAYAVVGNVDELNTVTFGSPLLLQAGLADYERLDGSGRNRWGDYSATVVDPTDSRTFWTFQEYVSANNEWSVQITQIVVPEPANYVLATVGLILCLGIAYLRRGRQATRRSDSRITPPR